MRKPGLCGGACATVVAFGALTGPALAQPSEEPSCGKFQLIRNLDQAAFFDEGDTGATAGDRRVVRWDIRNKEGELVGNQYSVSTMMPAEPDRSNLVMADSVITFDMGTLRISVLAPLSDPADTSRASDIKLEWTVLGGTGELRDARGIVTTTPLENGTYAITFDLSCPRRPPGPGR